MRPLRWVVLLLLASCQERPNEEEVGGYPLAGAPASWRPSIEKAEAAVKTLKQRLGGRLKTELAAGGPSKAIAVCQKEARPITGAVAREHGVTLGRTSARLRNRDNAAPPWARVFLREVSAHKAAEVEPRVFDLEDRIGVVRPIPTAKPCTLCHGAPERLDPAVGQTLRDAYPYDRAVGYDVGDLRGLFWVEVPKPARGSE